MENSEGSEMGNKNILIGLTGSIACFKICELIRLFKKNGFNVKTVVCPSAFEFIGAKTLETLTGDMVYHDTFAERLNTEHISLADWADIFVVAPITANTISKFAAGIADNLLTSIFCAYMGSKKPVVIAPAMNTGMLNNPFVIENTEKLKQEGVKVVETEVGELACGAIGDGRMASAEKIFDITVETLTKQGFNPNNRQKKIVITTGGTKEPIDPVRFISNESSGRMGFALADVAYSMGYTVELISAVKTGKKPYTVKFATTAEEMLEETKKSFENADYLIMAAAVADFKVKNPSAQKITKETTGGAITIELTENPDILETLGKNKKENQKTIGFSLATENLMETAKAKLVKKNADFIIANEAKTALNTDENEVWVIDKQGNTSHIAKTSKLNVAKAILELVL